MKYVLITAARNEAKFIRETLQSVVIQTSLPEKWIIMDDGSSDGTADIVKEVADTYKWIELVQRPPRADRSFSGKALAVNEAFSRLTALSFEVVGNLDADVSFGSDYVSFLLGKFAADPVLGIAGTPFTEAGYDSSRDSFEGENYVAGPCQLFRRSCFADIEGYTPNEAGGVDWIAVMTARLKGWRVVSFPDKRFHHHRSMGTAERGVLAALFSYGEKDYYLGGSPIWQLFRVTYRMTKRPVFVGGLALLLGYGWAALRRVKRPVTPELMRFHRQEQMRKLSAILRSLLTFKKPNSFSLNAQQEAS